MGRLRSRIRQFSQYRNTSMNNFKERHGKITYRMAIINECGLALMAWSMAAFNVVWVARGGLKLQGLILAVVWFALGIMEFATIPLAGSLRLCKWKDKWLAFIGVACLAFLSGFTVYEFNEFASYYLTKPARDALIQVEEKRQQLSNITSTLDSASKRYHDGANELKQLTQDQESQLALLTANYQRQMDILRAEHEAQMNGLNATRPMAAQVNSATEHAIAAVREQIARAESERDARMQSVQQEHAKHHAEVSQSAETRRKLLQSQRTSAMEQIDELRRLLLTEQQSVKTVFKSAAKRGIRNHYESQITEIQQKIAQIDQELLDATTNQPSSLQRDLAVIRDKSASAIAKLVNQMESLQSQIRQNLESEEQANAKEASNVRKETARLEKEYDEVVQRERAKYALEVAQIKQSLGERAANLSEARMSEAEFQKMLAAKHAEAASLESEINAIEAKTDSAMEPVLYYRIAKWFHDKRGLPSKDAYVRAQVWIFAPAGIFLSLVSITLAYVGTGLRVDNLPEERRGQFIRPLLSRLRVNRKENRRLRNRVQGHERQVDELMNRIVRAKTDMARMAAQIPQTIICCPPGHKNGHSLVNGETIPSNSGEGEPNQNGQSSRKVPAIGLPVPDSNHSNSEA